MIYLRHTFGLILIFAFSIQKSNAEVTFSNDSVDELIVYAMPTMYPLDWTSPSSIYKTMFACYEKTLTLPNNYLLGHAVVEIRTKLKPSPVWIAMNGADKLEKVQMVLIHKIGLGVLGAVMKGRMEPTNEILHNLEVYKQRNKLKFFKYQISRKSTERVLSFVESFERHDSAGNALHNYYSGAFWPEYINEGAGCTSFGISLLNVAGLGFAVPDAWKVELNVPMDLIGGKFNHHKRISFGKILKTKQWHIGNGLENKDFVKYRVYDPSLMCDWTSDSTTVRKMNYKYVVEDGVEGVEFDGRSIVPEPNTPLYKERPAPNLFVDRFKKDQTTYLGH